MPGGGTVPVPPPAQLLAGWWDSGDRNEPAVHVCKLSPASLLLKLIFMYEKKKYMVYRIVDSVWRQMFGPTKIPSLNKILNLQCMNVAFYLLIM